MFAMIDTMSNEKFYYDVSNFDDFLIVINKHLNKHKDGFDFVNKNGLFLYFQEGSRITLAEMLDLYFFIKT